MQYERHETSGTSFGKRKVTRVLAVCAAAALCAAGGDALAADAFAKKAELVKAFGGNTISFPRKQGGGSSIVFFHKDGSMAAASTASDLVLEGSWEVRRSDQFCRRYNGRPRLCMRVTLAGGKAKFHDLDGKLIYEAKIHPGKQMKPDLGGE